MKLCIIVSPNLQNSLLKLCDKRSEIECIIFVVKSSEKSIDFPLSIETNLEHNFMVFS